jgi:hypothetical protein
MRDVFNINCAGRALLISSPLVFDTRKRTEYRKA